MANIFIFIRLFPKISLVILLLIFIFFKIFFLSSPNSTPEMHACFNKQGYVVSLELGFDEITEKIIRYCQREVYGEEIRFPDTLFKFY